MVIHIFGAGGQGAWAAEVAKLAGLVPRMVERKDEAAVFADPMFRLAHVAIGDNFTRQSVSERIKSARPDVGFQTLVHPRATIAETASIGPGALILANAVVGPEVVAGEGLTVWTGAILEHHSRAGDFVSLAPNAATGGTVRLGDRVFLGIGAGVKHQISIGSDVVIGCGALVVSDIDGPCVAIGVPAKPVRLRAREDAYL